MNIDIKHLWIQKKVWADPLAKDCRERWPDAEVHPVESHWNIPELHGDPEMVKKWVHVKRSHLVIGHKTRYTFDNNGRSADFTGPQVAHGCFGACTYCYAARRKNGVNPITVYANQDDMLRATSRHMSRLGTKQPSQTHPKWWVYDIGCSSDVSVDYEISDAPRMLLDYFANQDDKMMSFATKFVNMNLLQEDPKGHTRIRFSVMPEHVRRVVDVNTHTTSAKIAAADDFVRAGYEVHFNFSPIIVPATKPHDWEALLAEMNDVLTDRVKQQAKAELIFLTHNAELHHRNLSWHPRGEDLLWTPDNQEPKRSQNGSQNIRYKWQDKTRWTQQIKELISDVAPWLEIRYAF